tara:strand:+ start:450 stop:734 length:285 start_codon:yes stop_codon:yes gene_type:complete
MKTTKKHYTLRNCWEFQQLNKKYLINLCDWIQENWYCETIDNYKSWTKEQLITTIISEFAENETLSRDEREDEGFMIGYFLSKLREGTLEMENH